MNTRTNATLGAQLITLFWAPNWAPKIRNLFWAPKIDFTPSALFWAPKNSPIPPPEGWWGEWVESFWAPKIATQRLGCFLGAQKRNAILGA